MSLGYRWLHTPEKFGMRCVFIGNFILHLIFTKLVLYAFQPEKPDPTKKVASYRYKGHNANYWNC
jgi:hypothetical protein